MPASSSCYARFFSTVIPGSSPEWLEPQVTELEVVELRLEPDVALLERALIPLRGDDAVLCKRRVR
jgi:hypothetical protein